MQRIWRYLKSQLAVIMCAVLTVALLGAGLLPCSSTEIVDYSAEDMPIAPLTEELSSPLRDVIVEKLKTQDRVKLDLFVMSQCPFAVRAEQALAPILKEFGDQIDFTLYFIASEDGSGGFTSLHGQQEVAEDIRQAVMGKYYPNKYFDYIVARAANYQDGDWEQQALELGIDVERVRAIVASEEGEKLLWANIQKGNELGIRASPTLLIEAWS